VPFFHNFFELVHHKDRIYDWFTENTLKVPPPWFPCAGSPHTHTQRHTHNTLWHDTTRHEQYGDVWMVTAPSKPWIVVVSDTKSIDHVLRTNFDNYVKGSPRTRTHAHAPYRIAPSSNWIALLTCAFFTQDPT
jgi:hypothetical protein